MNKKIRYSELFSVPCNNESLYKKIKVDQESISYITKPYFAEIIVDLINKHIKKYNLSSIHIVDMTACVGGDTISFSKNFNSVTAFEIDNNRYDSLINNITVYGLTNIKTYNVNVLSALHLMPQFDIVYMDPPWGGNDYKNVRNLRLTLSDIPIESIVINVFNENKMKCVPKLMVLKLPKNYDVEFMSNKLNAKNIKFVFYYVKKLLIVIIEKGN